MIRTGSLCTGYDGLGQALGLVLGDVEPQWFTEVEPGPSLVLAKEHPGVVNAGDIKLVPWNLAPPIDLLTSGDPCQSISIAGRKLGRDDPRFLWPDVRRAYRTLRPGGIFFENVANIVSHDGGRTLGERLDNLREDGYAVRWTVVGACAVGAPHHRHRWYALAAHVGPGAPAAVRIEPKAICGAPRPGGRYLLPTPTARDGSTRGEGSPEYWAHRLATRPDRATKGMPLGAVVNLLPTPDASMSTRGGFLSQPAALRRIADPVRSSNLDDVVASLLPTPRATDGPNGGPNRRNGRGEYDSLSGLVVNALPEVWGKYASAIALWEHVTGVPAPAPSEPAPKGGRRLSPALPEWMMGLRPGLLTDNLTRVEALKAAGNGVVALAAAAAYRLLADQA